MKENIDKQKISRSTIFKEMIKVRKEEKIIVDKNEKKLPVHKRRIEER